MSEQEEKVPRGIQSVEIAAELLEALIGFGGPVSLKDFSTSVGMSSARAFPYLVSLVRTGLVHKDEVTGLFEPGLLSQELGILGLHYLNPAHEAEPVIKELASATSHTVVLSVWGSLGPTVVGLEESRFSVYSEIRLGSLMPLTSSSIGRTFSAWIPAAVVDVTLAQQSLLGVGPDLSAAERKILIGRLSEVRERGMEIRQDMPIPGLSSMSAPVFGLSGEIVFVLTLFDETMLMDLEFDGRTALELQRWALDLSTQLGYVGG